MIYFGSVVTVRGCSQKTSHDFTNFEFRTFFILFLWCMFILRYNQLGNFLWVEFLIVNYSNLPQSKSRLELQVVIFKNNTGSCKRIKVKKKCYEKFKRSETLFMNNPPLKTLIIL